MCHSPRIIWEKPTAWLTSHTWGLINSPVSLNEALMRDGRSPGDTNQETAFRIPSAHPMSVPVTALSPSGTRAGTGSTPAAHVPLREPRWSPLPLVSSLSVCWANDGGGRPVLLRWQPSRAMGVWAPRLSRGCNSDLQATPVRGHPS